MGKIYYRWGDNDRRWGRLIYSRNGSYNPLAIVLASKGEEDEEAFNTLRISGFGHTLVVILPQIIKPWKRWVDTSHYPWSERGGYWDTGSREYGFTLSDGHLSVALGRVTNDSSTEQRWGWFLPWKEWRHVRHSWYGLRGEHIADMPQRAARLGLDDFKARHEEEQRIKAMVPVVAFEFRDFDGEQLTASTRIEEREWRRGVRSFRWLSLVCPKKIARSLDIQFSGETGRRKGSWKGGTVGHSIEMLSGELHEAAFRRYCAEHNMAFVGTPTHD